MASSYQQQQPAPPQQQQQQQAGVPPVAGYPGMQQHQHQMGMMAMNPMMQQQPGSGYQAQSLPQMPMPTPLGTPQHQQMCLQGQMNGYNNGQPAPLGMNGQDGQQAMQSQPPQPQQSLPLGVPPGLDREKLAAMSSRMAALRSQGFTEQTSPELAGLQNMLASIQKQVARFRQMQVLQQQQAQAQVQPGQMQQGGPMPMGMQIHQQPMVNGGPPAPQMQQNQMPMMANQANGPTSAPTPTNGSNANQTDRQSPGTANASAAMNGPNANGQVPAPKPTPPQQPQQHVNLTPQQMNSFKAQIFALRLLQKGLPLPANVASVIFGNTQPTQQSGSGSPGPAIAGQVKQDPDSSVSAGLQGSGQQPSLVPTPDPVPKASPEQQEPPPEPEIEIEEIPDTLIAPYTAYRNPRAVLAALRTAVQNDPYKTASLPSLLPQGLDAHTLQQERNRFIEGRIAQRRKELEDLPSIIGNEIIDLDDASQDQADGISRKKEALASKKLKALIELKSLNLLQKQRQLREDVVRGLNQAVSLNLVTDRNQYRASRKITLKDARSIDQLERQQKIDRENKAKQKHLDQLMAIARHGKAMEEAHQANKARQIRLGKSIMRWHVEAEKEEQKRIERVSKERLKALRNNDEEAYMKLIDTAKDTRIAHLLRQTDSFLDSLAQAVAAQQNEASDRDPMAVDRMKQEEEEVTDEATFGAVPVFQEEEKAGGKTDYYNVAHKIKETVTHQASILTGGQLKDYQIKGLQWMISLYNNRLNGILADEMGLGKTIQTISLITYLIDVKKQPGPFLCIVPLSTLPNWQLEFAKWAPTVHVVNYKGPPLARKGIQNQMKQSNFQVCLTTYEYIIKDRPFLCRYKWVHMIIDEGHRMKNSQSKLSQTLSQYYNSRYRLILTGTPLQNNLPELWALLNFVLPKVFNSQQSFDEWFNTPFANTGGGDKIDLNEEEALLVIRRLHKVLRPFLLRRLKKDVESELPDKVERLIRCKMSALQLKLYKRMKESGMLITSGEGKGGSSKLGMKGLQNTIMQLRKICNHPFVFQPVENLINPYGTSNELLYRTAGKFELLDRVLPKMFRGGHRILMFFQMTEIMTIMEDYLRFRNTKFLRLDGSTKPDERGEMLKLFNHPQSDIQIFLLSTRAGGLGLNLQTADTVIIYDSDWNPHQDLQAQDRAHRIGQKKEVRIFRFVTEKSIEEHILARAREKLEIDKKVIQGGRFDNKSSASEREEFLRAILENNEEDEDDTADLGDDELNDILARGEDERELFTQMDHERVQNEELAWIRAGNRGPMPERLITDAELPDVYHVEHSLAPAVEEILDQRRKKTNVHYDDGLTEEQWTAAIEDDNMDLADVIERNRRGELGIPDDDQFSTSDGRTRGNSMVDYDSDNNSPGPTAANKKRKRGRPSAASRAPSADLGSINGDMQTGGKRRKTAKQPAYEDPELKRMKEIMEACFEAVEEVDNPEEGHQCCGLFYKLPSKKEYPVYYVMILKPICMDQIKKKIDKMQYRSLDEFTEDFRLMFTNARIYNEDGSTVWKDANYMEQAFMHKFNDLTQPPPMQGGHFGDGIKVKTIIESDEEE